MKSINYILSFILFSAINLNAHASFPSHCRLSEQNLNYLLTLSYDEFDQSHDGGWRTLSAEKCYFLAGKLIDVYLNTHPELLVWQSANLLFHAGQLYAFDNRNFLAVQRMRDAVWSLEGFPNTNWNGYVNATIFFLQKNRVGFNVQRQVVLRSTTEVNKSNAEIVDNMLRHFHASYGYVYGVSGRD
jgi:hypothetical protein